MRILVYWEQDSWGGVDSHLLELLSSWPADDDFVLMHNEGNRGLERIRLQLEQLPRVRLLSLVSCSYNELLRRWRGYFFSLPFCRFLYFMQPLTFWLMARRIRGAIDREERFDVLLADNGGYPAAWGVLSALLAAFHVGIPVRILLVHHAATSSSPLMGWFAAWVDRIVSKTANTIVCVSYATRQKLLDKRQINDEVVPIRVIYNSMLSHVKPCLSAEPVFNLRGVLNGAHELLIGIVGRVDSYKGHEDILFALARLDVESKRRIRLVVIGAGERSELERLVRIAQRLGLNHQVEFLGYVPGCSSDLICQLDLLVVATRSFEGFGLTLAEAMQVGTPVLATRVGAIPEFLDDEIGKLVGPGSPSEMAVALNDFVANRTEWLKRADRAKDRILNNSQMAVEYRLLFQERLSESDETFGSEH